MEAPLLMKSSIFSEMSNTMAIIMIRASTKKNVPMNFRKIYQSISFKLESVFDFGDHHRLPFGKVTLEDMPSGLTDQPKIEPQVVDRCDLPPKVLIGLK